MNNTVILIPALNPDEKLVQLTEAVFAQGFKRIVVIDDGSDAECADFFRQAEEKGCVVARHEKNRGKGAALKTGIQTAIRNYGEGSSYITADADGQHLPEDMLKIAESLERYPDSLILGTRDFKSSNVPWRSRLGNRITSVFFRLTSGMSCPDTQTGLRGIPAALEKFALSVEGDRYEYEMNFLTDAARKVPFRFVPIQTVYLDGNSASHFRTVVDSALVYGRFLRFIGASLIGAATDFIAFYLLSVIILLPQTPKIFLATALARILSGTVNYLLNRFWSFQSRQPAGKEILRYCILFICQMGASAGLVSLLTLLPIPVVAAKLIVDICLFIVSFAVQKNWVFKKEADK